MNKFQNRCKVMLSLAFLLLSIGTGLAETTDTRQNTISVTGTVTSASDGMPLIGVSIVIKGTAEGTVTDMDGNYKINVPSNATLVFSYIVSP